PDELAVRVVAEQAVHAEVRVNPFAVGHRRLGGVRVGGLLGDARFAFEGELLPEHFACGTVEAIHLPTILDVRRTPAAATAAPGPARPAPLGPPFLARAGGGQEDLVAPADRRRPAVARELGLPLHILLRAPLQGELLLVGYAGAPGTAELRPVIAAHAG